MLFSKRQEIAKEYKKWLQKIKEEELMELLDNVDSVLCFLNEKGYLKEK